MWTAPALVVASHTRADPDLWGHVRFGLDMLAARTVHVADTYAFTDDLPWVNHEWLAEVVMAGAWASAGTPGLVFLKLLLTALVWLPIDRLLAVRAPRLRAAGPLLVVTALWTWGNTLRPQQFSFALFAVLVWLLARSRAQPRGLWWIPVVSVAWVNLHGGWLVGGMTLASWAIATLLLERDEPTARVKPLVVGAVALCATLLSPYGLGMWHFLQSTVGFGRADIVDWQPIYRAEAVIGVLWAACVSVIAAACRRAPRPDARQLAVLVTLGIAAFQVSRIGPFFALATVAFAGPVLATRAPLRRTTPLPRAQAAGGMALLAVGAVGLVGDNSRCIRMDRDWLPDVETSRALLDLAPGRVLPLFGWGEMVIWHRGPALQVSIDGRRETLYSERVRDAHIAFYRGLPGTEAYPDELGADYVWIPRDFAVANRLVTRGWHVVAQGDRAVLLARHAAPPPDRTEGQTAASRCFPGP